MIPSQFASLRNTSVPGKPEWLVSQVLLGSDFIIIITAIALTANVYYFLFFLLKLIYNVLLISALQQSDPVIHISTFPFLYFFPRGLSQETGCTSLCYRGRTSLLIHFKCNSLHLLTPSSHSI